MKSAITISKFYISQVKLIHSDGEGGENGTDSLAPLYRKIIELSNRKGWITARDVARSSSSFKKYKPDEIRALFHELEQMGMAKLDGKGTTLKLSSLSSPVVKVSLRCNDKVKHNNSSSSKDFSSSNVKETDFCSGETVVDGIILALIDLTTRTELKLSSMK